MKTVFALLVLTFSLPAFACGENQVKVNNVTDRVGVGIALTKNEGGELSVASFASGSIAGRSGQFERGDVITAIKSADEADWTLTNSLTVTDATQMIRGEVGTNVWFKIKRKNSPQELEVILSREHAQHQHAKQKSASSKKKAHAH